MARILLPRVIAKMSFQRVLENALRFAENVPDDGLDPSDIDRRETVISDLKEILRNVTF